ncbi:magnesium chelatase subunit H [Candidatus Viridilinea mediisalina]|uniref:magnesium chelatase n=1 Tax=Candidatus Viridilinea mediisalina TaxID=2024553 RepID=A0A2A6RJ59_9CHLR|nr:magnesium chelatase subunit H [Candidatus Viridilinea mediisalina]PDW03164.1 magnesium chelatase subunit H [Candidatus Viridilinea mediisalina]
MARKVEFVLVLGLQRYSQGLFNQAEAEVRKDVPGFRLHIFEDRDLQQRPAEVEAALGRAACVIISLISLAESAEWLVPAVERTTPPVVFAFESLPEVMRLTKVGGYAMGGKGGGGGMPKPVQNVAKLLVGNREEDALYGYVKLQKITSKLINFLPGKRLNDFRNWVNVSTYWSTRNVANTAAMFKLIMREYCGMPKLQVPPPVVVPDMGFAHPEAPKYFAKPDEYVRWEKDYRKQRAKATKRGMPKPPEPLGTVALLSFRSHILGGTSYHNDVVHALEAANLRVLPIFVQGIESHVVVREWLGKLGVDAVVNTMGFPLVGGPAGSSKAGLTVAVARELLSKLDVPYVVASPLFVQDEENWREHGVGPLQATMIYSLPEMDGAIAPVVLGGMRGSEIHTVPDRLARLGKQLYGYTKLRKTANRDKKVALVVYNYPPNQGNTATAALLDVPASLIALLDQLKAAGYTVGEYPRDPATLTRCLEGSLRADLNDVPPNHPPINLPTVDQHAFNTWVCPDDQERVGSRWGAFPGDIAPAGRDRVRLGGMRIGNVYIGVQPIIGMPGDPMRLLFDRENTPHHQYILFYKYLSEEFGADAVIHMGMHGTAEWMPGVQLGMTGNCWSDVLLGDRPQFYVYPINNPAEANIAKRRGYATIIGHAIPPYGRAGLYKELQGLKDLLEEYRGVGGPGREDRAADSDVETAILQKIDLLNLEVELARRPDEPFGDFVGRAYAYMRELEGTLITGTLHILGSAPEADEQLTLIVEALKVPRDGNQGLGDLALNALRQRPDLSSLMQPFDSYGALLHAARRGDQAALQVRDQLEAACNDWVRRAILGSEKPDAAWRATFNVSEVVPWAMALNPLAEHGRGMLAALKDNTQELDYLLHGLEGKYIPAAPGGDLIRDGLAVLPTGRNIHSLDPFRVPSDSAYQRGVRIAEALIQAHIAEHDGEFPETIAQVLWGLDAIKTKGESIGVILGLIGARPLKDGQGKIGRYELIPLEELGRPRVDVLMTASGIFRDTFAGTIDLLDRLVREAAAADEPEDQNFIRKHVNAMLAEGKEWEQATARVFTQAEGTYGTDVDEAIDGGAWEERQDLEELFIKRNAFAFGGEKAGQAQPEVLRSLLKTVGRVAQEIDSVEYGLTDMQHYYGYSGALKAAAERATGKSVALNYVESFTAETKVQSLDQVLRVEYRTKLLNPKWYEGMLKHGHNGAAEIANRFTYMLGWSATTEAVDKWVYDEAANTFVLDDAMRQRLEAANPEATRNAVGRLLEANSRGIWQTDDETLDKLRELYADLEDRLEGVS